MAYLLDTNIISELRPQRRRISPFVQAWYDRVPDGELFLSVLVLGEIRAGIEALRSRDCQAAINLERWFGETIQRYRERTLPITAAIADRWGRLSPDRPLPQVDGLLAATALEHDMVLVTRNTTDMARSGVQLLNPFENASASREVKSSEGLP